MDPPLSAIPQQNPGSRRTKGYTILCDMRLRLLPIVPIVFLGTALRFSAQNGPVGSTSIAKTQNTVGKRAAELNIALSDAARRELAVEAARQEAATPKGAEGKEVANAKEEPSNASGARVDELLNSIRASQPRNHLEAVDVKRVIIDDKTSKIRSTLDKDIDTQAKAANVQIPNDVRTMLARDIEKQTAGLASSGLPVDVIHQKNDALLKNIVQNLQGAPVTAPAYSEVQRAIFQRFVDLRIESLPPGANVRMNNIELGRTDIPRQPLEPGKMYQFEFALPGYKPAAREYFVAAADDNALLREPLEPETAKPDGQPQTTTGPVAVPKSASFPWLYVLIGVAALCILLLLARAR
jgi:PEGA domain-containing protein